MIDIEFVKYNYARMSNDQLINLAITEGHELAPEALSILHDEFLERKLDTTVFQKVDENKILKQKREIEKIHAGTEEDYMQAIWKFAFDAKRDGKSNEEIKKGLMDRGLEEQDSVLIINSIENKATEIYDKYNTEVFRGGLAFIVGLIITIWTYSSAANGGTYVIAWGAIIFGAYRFIEGISNKGKYEAIIENIKNEPKVERKQIVENY